LAFNFFGRREVPIEKLCETVSIMTARQDDMQRRTAQLATGTTMSSVQATVSRAILGHDDPGEHDIDSTPRAALVVRRLAARGLREVPA